MSTPDDEAPQRRRQSREPGEGRAMEGRLARTPDVRDGLTRVERIILVCLEQCQREKRGRDVSTAMLYGRVVEHIAISVPEFQATLQRLVGVR